MSCKRDTRAVHRRQDGQAAPPGVLLAVALGLAIAGILGALVATPIVAVAGAVLTFLRERADETS